MTTVKKMTEYSVIVGSRLISHTAEDIAACT